MMTIMPTTRDNVSGMLERFFGKIVMEQKSSGSGTMKNPMIKSLLKKDSRKSGSAREYAEGELLEIGLLLCCV